MLRRLAFIRAARTVGLGLDEVARGARRAARRAHADQGRLDPAVPLLAGPARRADRRAEALRDGLDSCIGCGCLSLRRCAISNPGDVAAAGGPGAAYLPRALRGPTGDG